MWACSCGQYLLDLPAPEMGWTHTQTDRLSSFSGLIFHGTLIREQDVFQEQGLRLELVFKVIRYYRGNEPDTVSILTNKGSDACGFTATTGTECLIFANIGQDGQFYTYRSDCCKSISQFFDPGRFDKYLRFLEIVRLRPDGVYDFRQAASYWLPESAPDTLRQREALRFAIKNGALHGRWQLTDRMGRVLEIGQYKKGREVGWWRFIFFYAGEKLTTYQRIEKVKFVKGKARQKKTTLICRDLYHRTEKIEYFQMRNP